MKQKLLTRLMLAGLAGAAFSGTQAGQIQASSVSIAREAITSDTQAITSPSISYRFNGDVDARVQAQTFQVQFILEQGAWAGAPNAGAFSISDGVTGQIQDQAAGAATITNSTYSVVSTAIDTTDKKILWVTFTVNQGAAALIKQPIVSLNVTSNTIGGNAAVTAGITRATVNGLKTVVGDIAADYAASPANAKICAAVKTARVGVKHYVGLQNPAAIATDTNGTPDEHTRTGFTNSGTLITFPTNLGIKFVSSTGSLKLTSGGNTTFDSTGAGPVVNTAAGTPLVGGTAHVATAGAGQLVARLGTARFTQEAVGLDSGLTATYALANGGDGITNGLATAVGNNGEVEAKSFDLQVTASNGFAVGSSVYAALAGANCAAAIGSAVVVTSTTAAGPITVSVTANSFGVSGTEPVEICYSVPVANTAVIPSSAFTVVGTLVKSAAGGNNAEQNNTCNGTLYSLGGGLKIDVRNYASSAEKSGYASVLRFINNSDVVTADVFAQVIHQDGKLGNWAKLTDLAPRGSLNMTAAQIDAKLAAGTAPGAAVAANNGAAAAAYQAGNATSSDTAPRLRITSNSGNSLRVQNYLFNAATGQILEASGSQAVDFNGNNDRAPGSDGQYISQDANSGINLK